MNEAPKKSIFITDDHPVFRMGLRELVNAQTDLVVAGEATSLEEAKQRLETMTPDAVVIDLALGDTSGLELVRWLGKRDRVIPSLVVSMHDEALFADRALRTGAQGYLMKDSDPEILLDGIRKVLSGEQVVSPSLSAAWTRGGSDPLGKAEDPLARLSTREMEVFELMGRGLRTREISQQLSISVKTVETHQSNTKQKLGLTNATQLLRAALAWQNGIRLDPGQPGNRELR
ncbi:MAG: response regulator transcription factor [Myxococcota bacterium]